MTQLNNSVTPFPDADLPAHADLGALSDEQIKAVNDHWRGIHMVTGPVFSMQEVLGPEAPVGIVTQEDFQARVRQISESV